MKTEGETRKAGPVVTVSAIVLVLAVLAYMGHRAAVNNLVESLYGKVLDAPPVRPEKYPTEAARLDRCRILLFAWRSLDTPTMDFVEMQAALPFPLRITGTTRVANPENLRKRAGEIFARDLAALSGRQVANPTLSAWEREIEAWGAAISR